MSHRFTNKRRMKDDEQPVVEDADLPEMDDELNNQSQTEEEDGDSFMLDDPQPDFEGEIAEDDEPNLMDPVPDEVAEIAIESTQRELKQQESREEEVPVREEGYIRLRLQVDDDELSVTDARVIEGPLITSEKPFGEFVYEVTRNQRLLSTDSILDAGVKRSYPSPEHPSMGHINTPLSSLEFNVRVPRQELSESTLPETDITVYRVKESVPDTMSDEQPIDAQFTRELREVSRLEGIQIEELDEDSQQRLKNAL